MVNMFTNYENDQKKQLCEAYLHPTTQKEPKIITNIKGDILGVQIEHSNPLRLYFHLEDICEVEVAEIIQGTTVFEILTTTHKSILSVEYLTAEILNQTTNDLFVSLSQAEMETLKKETYNMRVTLKTAENTYEVFAEKDGYLIVR
jgi:hypothetical protein